MINMILKSSVHEIITSIANDENWVDFNIDDYSLPVAGTYNHDRGEFQTVVLSTQWQDFEKPTDWPRKPSWDEIVLQHQKVQADRYINGPDDFSTEDGLDFRTKKLLENLSLIHI